MTKKKPNGYWQNFENTKFEALEFMEKFGYTVKVTESVLPENADSVQPEEKAVKVKNGENSKKNSAKKPATKNKKAPEAPGPGKEKDQKSKPKTESTKGKEKPDKNVSKKKSRVIDPTGSKREK